MLLSIFARRSGYAKVTLSTRAAANEMLAYILSTIRTNFADALTSVDCNDYCLDSFDYSDDESDGLVECYIYIYLGRLD